MGHSIFSRLRYEVIHEQSTSIPNAELRDLDVLVFAWLCIEDV